MFVPGEHDETAEERKCTISALIKHFKAYRVKILLNMFSVPNGKLIMALSRNQ